MGTYSNSCGYYHFVFDTEQAARAFYHAANAQTAEIVNWLGLERWEARILVAERQKIQHTLCRTARVEIALNHTQHGDNDPVLYGTFEAKARAVYMAVEAKLAGRVAA